MKPQELRVENLVYDRSKTRIVKVWGIESNHDQITVNHANGSAVYKVDLKDIVPIDLTEEWLLKMGFEFSHEIIKEALYGENPVTKDYLIVLKNTGDGWFYRNGYFKMKHVHQLQNVYFALTGEELKIKE